MDAPFITHQPSLAAATALLRAAELPTADLSVSHLHHFFAAGPSESPAGLVGLEFHGPNALLRSLVVDAQVRMHGIGSRLVEHAEAYARRQGAQSIYLLTTTAENFFACRDYIRADRRTAPDEIRATAEFSSLCPASSVFMVKNLRESPR